MRELTCCIWAHYTLSVSGIDVNLAVCLTVCWESEAWALVHFNSKTINIAGIIYFLITIHTCLPFVAAICFSFLRCRRFTVIVIVEKAIPRGSLVEYSDID